MRVAYIRFGERWFKRMLNEARQELRQALANVQTSADVEGAIENLSLTVDVEEYFRRFYVHVGTGMAGKVKINLTRAKKRFNFANDLDIWTEQMIEFVETRCGVKIAQTTRMLFDDIEAATVKALRAGTEAGWGADRIAKEIMIQQGKISEWRALRIARTEAVGASNEGAMMGVESTGIQVYKVWLATGFPGPSGYMREDHDAMNNERVDYNEPFVLPDGSHLDYPGDPSGDPKHIINCRCAVGFEPKDSLLN